MKIFKTTGEWLRILRLIPPGTSRTIGDLRAVGLEHGLSPIFVASHSPASALKVLIREGLVQMTGNKGNAQYLWLTPPAPPPHVPTTDERLMTLEVQVNALREFISANFGVWP
jgi:hypothetical protein